MKRTKRHGKSISIEDIKSIKEYEGLSDKEAQQIIDSLELLAVLTFEYFQKSQKKKTEP